MNTEIKTVDEYIALFSSEIQDRLLAMRKTIIENAPLAIESVAYGMPAYKLNKKPLVYFAGYAKHIGFYATPNGHQAFESQLVIYKKGKGSVQFPINQPLPLDLIAQMVRFRVDQNSSK
jgi:uncharacterized protein YdhG (YjbR/CyaY superfamily)